MHDFCVGPVLILGEKSLDSNDVVCGRKDETFPTGKFVGEDDTNCSIGRKLKILQVSDMISFYCLYSNHFIAIM